MEESGRFRYVRELLLHDVEEGDAERVVGLARSVGPVMKLLELGHSEEELGLAQLRGAAERALGDRRVRFWFGYHVRVGVR